MARNLRAKLQYAAYKVRHNVAHLTLEELEAKARQETVLVARALDPSALDLSAQARAFVAAAAPAATGDRTNEHRQTSTASHSAIPTGISISTSNLRGPPRTAADQGVDARQTLYASILGAQPPPGISRTEIQLAKTPSGRRGDGNCLVAAGRPARGNKNSKVTASVSDSKRKPLLNTSPSEARKRVRSDDVSVTSPDGIGTRYTQLPLIRAA